MPQKNTKTFMAFNLFAKNRSLPRVVLFALLAVCLVGAVSCKKAIEQQQRNIIIDAVTNGRWFVQQYKENTVDVTGEFAGYEFQFYENGNVDGIKNGVSKPGTWTTDIPNYTISATFAASAGDTLRRLNYTWKITDSYLDYVEAKTTTANGDNILHLKKK